jgi:uncharacterized delta-60 repeat protein
MTVGAGRVRAVALPVVALMLAVSPAPSTTSAGSIDTGFGMEGHANASKFAGRAWAIAVQSDGKIVAVGTTEPAFTAGEQSDMAIARFDQDGNLDVTFGGDGHVAVAFPSGRAQAHAVAIQPDGKIVVAGCTLCSWFSSSDFAAARLNANGTLDVTFGESGKIDGLPRGLADSACLVVPALLTADAYGVVVQSTGRIVVGGWLRSTRQDQQYENFALAAYTSAGSLDCTFGSFLGLQSMTGLSDMRSGIQTTHFGDADWGFAMALQSDDKIILAGHTNAADGNGDAAVARYAPDGLLDPAFGTGGTVRMNFNSPYRAVQGVALQPDGKLIVAGVTYHVGANNWTNEDFALARFTTTGTPDQTFGDAGKIVSDFGSPDFERQDIALGVAVQPDGRIVAVGDSFGGFGSEYRHNVAVARYNVDGSIDQTFGSSGVSLEAFGIDPNDVAIQGDGRILVATWPFGILRYLP